MSERSHRLIPAHLHSTPLEREKVPLLVEGGGSGGIRHLFSAESKRTTVNAKLAMNVPMEVDTY
jgi:hypothetical protein